MYIEDYIKYEAWTAAFRKRKIKEGYKTQNCIVSDDDGNDIILIASLTL